MKARDCQLSDALREAGRFQVSKWSKAYSLQQPGFYPSLQYFPEHVLQTWVPWEFTKCSMNMLSGCEDLENAESPRAWNTLWIVWLSQGEQEYTAVPPINVLGPTESTPSQNLRGARIPENPSLRKAAVRGRLKGRFEMGNEKWWEPLKKNRIWHKDLILSASPPTFFSGLLYCFFHTYYLQ